MDFEMPFEPADLRIASCWMNTVYLSTPINCYRHRVNSQNLVKIPIDCYRKTSSKVIRMTLSRLHLQEDHNP